MPNVKKVIFKVLTMLYVLVVRLFTRLYKKILQTCLNKKLILITKPILLYKCVTYNPKRKVLKNFKGATSIFAVKERCLLNYQSINQFIF